MLSEIIKVFYNKRMKNEPVKHHYIPQFLIKNFSDKKDGYVWYYTKQSEEPSLKHCSEIFVYKNLYRDEINSPGEPTKIENDLSAFEREMSEIINKLLVGSDIVLNIEEYEKTKLFFSIMAFRSSNAYKIFSKRLSKEGEEFFSFYQGNEDFVDFWKRNLGHLVNCRSIKEVLLHDKIDKPIKAFMTRDTFGLTGLFISIVERRGDEDFFLSDIYPLMFSGETPDGKSMLLYSIVPISSERALIFASNGIVSARLQERFFGDNIFRKPMPLGNRQLQLHVKKVYERDVHFINSEIVKYFEEAAFKEKDKFKYFD